MKTIKDLTSRNINKICSIIIEREITCGQIRWTPEHDYVIASWKKEESDDPRYDWVEMRITINEDLQVNYEWNYINEIKPGAKGMGVIYRPLHNHHKITKYLIKEGFDV